MRTDEDLRGAAFLALREALGPSDPLRFLRLYTGSDFRAEQEFFSYEAAAEELTAAGKAAGQEQAA